MTLGNTTQLAIPKIGRGIDVRSQLLLLLLLRTVTATTATSTGCLA